MGGGKKKKFSGQEVILDRRIKRKTKDNRGGSRTLNERAGKIFQTSSNGAKGWGGVVFNT